MSNPSAATPGYVVKLLRGKVYYFHDIRFEQHVPVVILDDEVAADLLDDTDDVRSTDGEIVSRPRFEVKYFNDVSEHLRGAALGDTDKGSDAKAKLQRLQQLKATHSKLSTAKEKPAAESAASRKVFVPTAKPAGQ